MQEEKTEGIVVRSQDYKERHRIITLFTPEGLLSLIVRGISRKNTRLLSLTSLFCLGEYLYVKKRSELLSLRDAALLDEHLSLRDSLASLQTAGALANAILTSQMPGKPSPALYLLYKLYHRQVPHFADPSVLLASFYLKLLKHEGLLHLSSDCAACAAPSALATHEGESFCPAHAPSSSLRFTPPEWESLLALDNAQHFSLLQTLSIAPAAFSKIHSLFHARLSH
jgi:DNA repair protein RecO (recombination protein O)